MTDKKGSKEKELEELEKYLCLDSSADLPNYYVKDIQNCDISDVEYIFLCESPHVDEVTHVDTNGELHSLPLVGQSGKYVSSFLFGLSDPIGELIYKDKDKDEHDFKNIAIVNVSNVPLQINDKIGNRTQAGNLDLEKIRENLTVIKKLRDNLKNRLLSYKKVKTIIVCGTFAYAYFSAIIDEDKESFKKINIIAVPHPARNQWNFVFDHTADIVKLKHLFE